MHQLHREVEVSLVVDAELVDALVRVLVKRGELEREPRTTQERGAR